MAWRDISQCMLAHAVFLLVLSPYIFQCLYAADTISIRQRVTVSDTIVSADDKFELGFFLPSNNSNAHTNYYVGIWYKKVTTSKFVWVANRDYAFTSTAVLTISNGNLVIMDGKVIYMVSNVSSNKKTRATLLPSGNLVLRDENLNVLWQSFDFPTHIFLPGMKFGYDRSTGKNWSLVSWKSPNDPSPGDYSLMLDPTGTQIFIMKGTQIYWTSGTWNGHIFTMVPEMRLNYIYNFSYVLNENASYFTYSLYNNSIISRLKMDSNGQIQQESWLEPSQLWVLFWSQPKDHCDVYGYCGVFAYCKPTAPFCECLRGFEPSNPNNWVMEVYSEGCTRKASLQCGNVGVINASEDGFVTIRNVLVADPNNTAGVSLQECQSSCLNTCTCTAFAYSDSKCSTWQGDLINLKQPSNGDTVGQDLHVRLAASELSSTNSSRNRKRNLLIITTSTVSFMILASSVFIGRMRKRKHIGKGEDLLSFDFSAKPGPSKYETTEGTAALKGRKDVEIPLFSFSSVSVATNGFSSENKLGEGGFGPVYKGKLLNGHKVAVKRLSKRSGQGWEELKNEALLIAKLQHKNLVKLLGWCIEGEEKILVYEYLQNKSLDLFLFGRAKHAILDWGTRFRIIEGIAQGILYLHQFSRLQIIHRDLKASNVLLDKDMNPKISDFGMAKIFGGKESQATNRIVGTYGYMSPEYAMEGIFSVKSDVFSFGVLLLEILSGKKNTGFYNTDSLNLLGYAWDLWRSGRSLELMDPTLDNISTTANAAVRYINIALLCVQERASDRPNMSDVISMLSSEGTILPIPTEPAFSNVRSMHEHPSQFQGNEEVPCSVNEMTVSILEAR